MKYFLLFVGFIIHITSLIAQHSGYNYYGHLTSFQPGCYYTHTGTKVEGLLKLDCSNFDYNIGSNSILFKANQDDKKKHLTVVDVKAFVIGKDSFAIIKSFSVSSERYCARDFAKVIETGTLNLYLHGHVVKSSNGMTTVTTGTEYFYFIEKDGAVYRMKGGEFKKRANFIFGEDKELMVKIDDKKLLFSNLEQIVEEYNNWSAQQNKGK
jgi:hypothetical protein